MVFFELHDIEKMLDQTNDPIADMINAVNADIMTFAACRTYEGLLADSDGLSKNESYQLLMNRMESIGYKLSKVVYRGYTTSNQLQLMHESAISSRTKLRLDADTQKQEQINAASLLIAREEQNRHRFDLEASEAEHKARLAKVKTDQELMAQRAQVSNKCLSTLNYYLLTAT